MHLLLARACLLACSTFGVSPEGPYPCALALRRCPSLCESDTLALSLSLSLPFLSLLLSGKDCTWEKAPLGDKNISMIWRPVSETLRIELAKLALKKQAATQTHERCTVLPSSYCWTQRRRIKDCPCHMFEHSLLSPEWLAGGVGARAEAPSPPTKEQCLEQGGVWHCAAMKAAHSTGALPGTARLAVGHLPPGVPCSQLRALRAGPPRLHQIGAVRALPAIAVVALAGQRKPSLRLSARAMA